MTKRTLTAAHPEQGMHPHAQSSCRQCQKLRDENVQLREAIEAVVRHIRLVPGHHSLPEATAQQLEALILAGLIPDPGVSMSHADGSTDSGVFEVLHDIDSTAVLMANLERLGYPSAEQA